MRMLFVLCLATPVSSFQSYRSSSSLRFAGAWRTAPSCKTAAVGSSRRTLAPALHAAAAARYGPADEHHHDDDDDDDDVTRSPKKASLPPPTVDRFRQLVAQVLSTSDPQHIPSLLTKQAMPLILLTSSSSSSSTQLVEMVQTVLAEYPPDQQETVAQAIDMILEFVQDFCQETEQLDRQNKELLGKILKTMSSSSSSSSSSSTSTSSATFSTTRRQREDALQELFETEQFSAGFLRHLQGECERIASASKITKESARLLETLHVIQTRVLEELAQQSDDLGPAAQVLGQLIGYESAAERLAVLEAGLAVRGVAFAEEMRGLTQEALEGFSTRPDVEPGLVACIGEIDERLRLFVQENQEKASFQ